MLQARYCYGKIFAAVECFSRQKVIFFTVYIVIGHNYRFWKIDTGTEMMKIKIKIPEFKKKREKKKKKLEFSSWVRLTRYSQLGQLLYALILSPYLQVKNKINILFPFSSKSPYLWSITGVSIGPQSNCFRCFVPYSSYCEYSALLNSIVVQNRL